MTTPSDKSGRAATLIPYARSILQAMKENGYRGTVWDDVLNEYEKATAPLPETGTFNQDALDRASWELQRHFGREGSIYGIKACEEIARIALVAYGALSATQERKA